MSPLMKIVHSYRGGTRHVRTLSLPWRRSNAPAAESRELRPFPSLFGEEERKR